jgi:DNA polymerase III subunit epsilon
MIATRPDNQIARIAATQWAKDLLSTDFVVLDTETTGTRSKDEVIHIAVIDKAESVLVNSYVKPKFAIDEQGEAFLVNFISNAMVENAPTFYELWPGIRRLIADRPIVAYNANYDKRMVEQSLALSMPVVAESFPVENHWKQWNPYTWIDAMMPYSSFVGEWNYKYKNYRWQKLPGSEHGSLADCRATLKVIQMMANS